MHVSLEACSVADSESLCAHRGFKVDMYCVASLRNVSVCSCCDVIVESLYGIVNFCVVSAIELCWLVYGG